MKNSKHLGETRRHNQSGQMMTIIEYHNSCNVTVQFEDGTIVKNVRYPSFARGCPRHPRHMYFGAPVTHGPSKEDIHTKAYYDWYNMLNKCYGPLSNCKTYQDCTVCQEWLDFRVFKAWHDENYYEVANENTVIDKDILAPYRRPKEYGPDTCLVLPHRVNTTAMQGKNGSMSGFILIASGYKVCCQVNDKQRIIGIYDTAEDAFLAYKAAKEAAMRQLAERYDGILPEKVIQAMITWEYVPYEPEADAEN